MLVATCLLKSMLNPWDGHICSGSSAVLLAPARINECAVNLGHLGKPGEQWLAATLQGLTLCLPTALVFSLLKGTQVQLPRRSNSGSWCCGRWECVNETVACV